jgi:hypothetical protein
MKEEYTAETYPSFGKKYNGEKAIISLTSWKARINTVSKTLFSLIKQCPGFHIVLVLSEEEFPKMMDELPDNLKLFVDNEFIEVLWVFRNYKSYKKVLFTMDKYRDVPVISADDGCVFTKNYAEHLYKTWVKNPKNVICNIYRNCRIAPGCGGDGGVLYPPHCFKSLGLNCLFKFFKLMIKNPNDDRYIANLCYYLKIKIIKASNILPICMDFDNFGMTKNKLYLEGKNWLFLRLIKETNGKNEYNSK